MGWYYTLELRCEVLPEYCDFFTKDYMRTFSEHKDLYKDIPEDFSCECDTCVGGDGDATDCICYTIDAYNKLNKSYKDLVDIWLKLDLGHHFYKYDVSGNRFTCKISKKVNRHTGDLWKDLEEFVKDIIVPTTSVISFCEISSDDYGDHKREYTDLELRGGRLQLRDMVRSLHHTWIDGAIAETRVVYKRSVPSNQQVDLERAYQAW
jgi:hypothetical protein